MLAELAAAAAGVAAIGGWIAAWRARGDSNAAGERARIAEVKADAGVARALDAEAGRAAAEAQLKAAAVENQNLRAALSREQATKGALLEKLAALGAPVGDVLLDSTIDRLYKNRDRQGNGSSSGAGGDPTPVPAGPAKPPTGTDPRG